jgi:hypothetical protein
MKMPRLTAAERVSSPAILEKGCFMRNPRLMSSLAVLATAQLLSGVAMAHIHLEDPMPRYPGEVSGENKACPCGVGSSNRTCRVEGPVSDPDRSTDRVTTLTAGSTIVMRFDEYVGHSGRYRVAFDQDGADLVDFNAHPLVDIPDPSGNEGNTGDGSIWEIEVPVPETPCDNCTLQLIQMMDGNMVDPVADPVGRSSYYQCADITIVAAGGGAAGASSEAVDAGANGVDVIATPESGCSLAQGSGPASARTRWQVLASACLLGFLGWRRRRLAGAR